MGSLLGPPVKCGYCGWLIQGCENILNHECLRHYDECIHYSNVDDNFVATLIPRLPDTEDLDAISHSSTQNNYNDDADELLIKAVFDRPALYNIKLTVKERTKLKIRDLWIQISNILEGTTPDDARKRWQYLRECFTKERDKQLKYPPSGSAACPSRKPSFRYYTQMMFLCDSLQTTQTISNIGMPLSPDDCGTLLPGPSSSTSTPSPSIDTENDVMISPTPPTKTLTPHGKKRKADSINSDLHAALVGALQQPIPQPDAVDGILARLGEGLRRLPYRERAALEIIFLTQLMEVEGNLDLT